MNNWSTRLFIIQAVALVGGLAGGMLSDLDLSSGTDVGMLIGFFAPAMAGVVMLFREKKKKNENKEEQELPF